MEQQLDAIEESTSHRQEDSHTLQEMRAQGIPYQEEDVRSLRLRGVPEDERLLLEHEKPDQDT